MSNCRRSEDDPLGGEEIKASGERDVLAVLAAGITYVVSVPFETKSQFDWLDPPHDDLKRLDRVIPSQA
ncbi:hypothetical protein YTPLAS18_00700 [Nitrospira sp.]|nr:hypothetical protein YTPLAS18_00700 [Nitrospira sp.]